jgi:hypothetical protein
VIPRTAVIARKLGFSLCHQLLIVLFFIAKELRLHKRLSTSKANPTGGIWPFIPLAITNSLTKVSSAQMRIKHLLSGYSYSNKI